MAAGAAALLAMLVCALPRADQDDPRLAELFSRLGDAPSRGSAQAVEQQIWMIWFESPGSSAREDLERARHMAESGATHDALAEFDRLVNAHPDYAEGWNQRAILRYLLGDVRGSLADIERVLALEPRHFGALSGQGQCYLRLERYRDALTSFEAALSINPWIESAARQSELLKAILQQQQPI
jgi:tetratricopeptide (TPR) repeat protein